MGRTNITGVPLSNLYVALIGSLLCTYVLFPCAQVVFNIYCFKMGTRAKLKSGCFT